MVSLWARQSGGCAGFQRLGLGDVKVIADSAVWIGVVGVPNQPLVASVTAARGSCTHAAFQATGDAGILISEATAASRMLARQLSSSRRRLR